MSADLVPPPVSPARGPPTDWRELVQAHDDRAAIQAAPDELPVIDVHLLREQQPAWRRAGIGEGLCRP